MASKAKKRKSIIITTSLILLILIIGFLAISQSIVGASSALEYETEWHFNDLERGVGESKAILKLPNETSEFSFTIDYSGDVESIRDKGTCYMDVKYQIFNYNTNSYEIIHDKSWSLKEYDIRDSKVYFDGENLYSTGKPEKIENINTQYSSSSADRRYDSYWGCPDGMSISELLQIIDYSRESDTRYTFKCLYAGDSISEHGADDDNYEHNDLIYFPKLHTFTKDYIKDNKAMLNIIVNKKSNCESIYEDDFKIDLWKLETPVIDTYSYLSESNTCDYTPKYTYQILESDYFTRKECEFSNNLIQCIKKTDCEIKEGLVSSCDGGECSYNKETIWNKIFPDKDEPIEEIPKEDDKQGLNIFSLIFTIVILTLIALIIRNLIKKRKK